MIQGTSIASAPAHSEELGQRIAFWACVGIVLVFSQFWVMPITGPLPTAIDPAVSAQVRNYYFPCYLLVLVMAGLHARGVAMAFLRAPGLSLLLLVTFASIGWSIDPDVTLRRCIAVFVTSLAGVVIAERFDWAKFLEVFAVAYGILVVLCFGFALFAPLYGTMPVEFIGAWRGVWTQKNQLGAHMSVAITVFAAAAIANPPRRWLWISAIGAAALLILMSLSKTSLASCVLGLSFIVLVAMVRRGPAWATAGIALWGAAALALGFILFVSPDLLLGLLGKDSTLTGRSKIWAAVAHQISHRPVTGYGFGAVWDSTSPWSPLAWISKEQGFTIHEAHNTWLGVWLELGLIGLAAWGLLFVEVWARALWGLWRRPAYFVLPFLLVFSLHTYTEAVALLPNDLVWLMFCAVAAKLAMPIRPPAFTA